MRIPQVRIQTTKAQLGMESQKGFLEHVNPPQQQLDIKTNLVKVEIRSRAPQIRIDQTQAFAESGLKQPLALSQDNSAYSNQKMMESIGKIVDQGNQLMAIENGGNPIPEHAVYNAYDQFVREWNMVTMPRSRPRIDLIEGTVDIQVRGGDVVNNTRPSKVSFNYQPGKLDIYLKQKDSISMSVVDVEV
jgi:hypothetical protein